MQAIEAIYNAVAEAMPEAVCACSRRRHLRCPVVGRPRGRRASSGPTAHRIRSGRARSIHGDGASARLHHVEAATRFAPLEVWEAKNPWLMECCELAPDSGGPGRHRGGLGLDMAFRLLEDAFAISTVERTKNAPWGLEGGGEARPNAGELRLPDGTVKPIRQGDAGSRCRRDPCSSSTAAAAAATARRPSATREAVLEDLREGYITEEHARASLPARVQRRLMHRCAVDVGGTFIDFVLLDEETGELVVEKQPARRETLVDEFLAGLERLPVGLPELDLLFHGTTVGINTVLQERGARVGLVTTAGFRDVLALGRGSRPELYNVLYRPPAPLVPRYLRREVPERLAGDGSVLVPLDLDALDREVDLLVDRGRRGGRDLLPPRIPRPAARAAGGGTRPGASSRARGHRVARGGDGVARVRAHLDSRPERLRPAAHGPIPRRARRAAARTQASSARSP